MSTEGNNEFNIYITTRGLINAEKMVQTMGIHIDRYESQLSQARWFINDTNSMLVYLKREVAKEYRVQSEDTAVRMYSADLIRDCLKKIDVEENRLISLLENARCLTDRIDGMKAQKIVYEENVLIAAAAWRTAEQHAIMQVESWDRRRWLR